MGYILLTADTPKYVPIVKEAKTSMAGGAVNANSGKAGAINTKKPPMRNPPAAKALLNFWNLSMIIFIFLHSLIIDAKELTEGNQIIKNHLFKV